MHENYRVAHAKFNRTGRAPVLHTDANLWFFCSFSCGFNKMRECVACSFDSRSAIDAWIDTFFRFFFVTCPEISDTIPIAGFVNERDLISKLSWWWWWWQCEMNTVLTNYVNLGTDNFLVFFPASLTLDNLSTGFSCKVSRDCCVC